MVISLLGWAVILGMLVFASTAALWLAMRIIRLARPELTASWWAAALAIITSSAALWILIPKAVPLILR